MKSRQKKWRDSRSRGTDGGEKIAVTSTYLPKNLTSYVNAPQVEKSGKFTRKVIYPSTDIFTSCLKSNCGAYFLVVTVT